MNMEAYSKFHILYLEFGRACSFFFFFFENDFFLLQVKHTQKRKKITQNK